MQGHHKVVHAELRFSQVILKFLEGSLPVRIHKILVILGFDPVELEKEPVVKAQPVRIFKHPGTPVPADLEETAPGNFVGGIFQARALDIGIAQPEGNYQIRIRPFVVPVVAVPVPVPVVTPDPEKLAIIFLVDIFDHDGEFRFPGEAILQRHGISPIALEQGNLIVEDRLPVVDVQGVFLGSSFLELLRFFLADLPGFQPPVNAGDFVFKRLLLLFHNQFPLRLEFPDLFPVIFLGAQLHHTAQHHNWNQKSY